MGVVDELEHGCDLVGEVPITNMLPQKFTPATLSVEGLRQQATLMRQDALHAGVSSGDDEIDKAVWVQTMQEVADQWLEGPLAADQVPSDAPISKRFGLKQGAKIRLIDDYSYSGVNSSVSSRVLRYTLWILQLQHCQFGWMNVTANNMTHLCWLAPMIYLVHTNNLR